MNIKSLLFLFFFVVGTVACSSDNFGGDSPWDIRPLASRQDLRVGALNAIRKAYQMTELSFTPKKPVYWNSGTYNADQTYKGLIYSSVKEIGTYVGSNVSFHTFMTAINNPRSVIYTEEINKAPYHGTNCHAYYGTVCSGLVSYALGISYGSYDFPVSDLMQQINHSCPENIEVADVLWRDGHVAIITDVFKNSDGYVTYIEYCEAVHSGCKRRLVSCEGFQKLMDGTFTRVYRYTELDKNTSYTPVTDFVAVLDEVNTDFKYNNDLCANKGDRSCYVEGENVVVNILRNFSYLEVYKNDEPYITITDTTSKDVTLSNLSYGDYRARICYIGNDGETGKTFSDFTCWKIINVNLSADRSSNKLFFSSSNAIPVSVGFCSVSGSRKYPFTEILARKISNDERAQGYLIIPEDMAKEDRPYVHVTFSTDYGNIINLPFNWFKQ